MPNSTLYSGGPAYSVWDSLTNIFRDNSWKVTNPDQFFNIPSNTGVRTGKGIMDKTGKVSGMVKIRVSTLAAQLAALFPYTSNYNSGGLTRPASDLPFVIHARNGGTDNAGLAITLYAAMLTKMPKLTFATGKPLVGSAEWTYLQALATAIGDSASLIGTSDSAYSEPSWNISDELFDSYSATLGFVGAQTGCGTTDNSTAVTCETQGLIVGQAVTGVGIADNTTIAAVTPGTGITLSAEATADGDDVTLTFAGVPIIADKEGWDFEPVAKLGAITPCTEPTRDYRLEAGEEGAIGAKLTFRPHNMDVDTFYSIFFPETTQLLGQSIDTLGTQVNIIGANPAGVNLFVPVMSRMKSGHDFSTKDPRTDKVELYAFDDNAGSDLFTLAVN